jgi:hypothetical protein
MSSLPQILHEIRPGALWNLSGDSLDGLEWLDESPVPTAAEVAAGEVQVAWRAVRAVRDRLLAASDWTQVADAPVDSAAWAAYRQELRDIPQDFASPDAVVWPSAP